MVAGVTATVPEVALVPVQAPLAVQEVALVEDHVSVDDWPGVISAGDAVKVTVGVWVVVPELAVVKLMLASTEPAEPDPVGKETKRATYWPPGFRPEKDAPAVLLLLTVTFLD